MCLANLKTVILADHRVSLLLPLPFANGPSIVLQMVKANVIVGLLLYSFALQQIPIANNIMLKLENAKAPVALYINTIVCVGH